MRLLAPFLLILAALLGAVVLDDTPTTADVVFVNRGDVFTLDPQRQSYVQDFRMSYALFEGLVRWDVRSDDFAIRPAAAALPVISDDRLTYTFTLRDDARWSNGHPLTTHDFVYSWMRLLLPDTAADYTSLIFCIRGAEPFWYWRRDQLAAFTADPWTCDPDDRRDAGAGVARRLRALLAADDLPPAVALGTGDHASLRRELDDLERVCGERGSNRAVEGLLPGLPMIRGQLEQLDAPESRAAETEWMWRRTAERFAETVGVVAEDARTLRVELARPTAYFLDLVSFGVCYPVYRPCVEGWSVDEPTADALLERGWADLAAPPWAQRRWVNLNPITGRFEQRHQWARPETLICNGPYRLEQWRYKRDIRLARNPHFHSPQNVRADTVVALTIEDANTRVLAFESGHLHWLSEVGVEYQADMIAERNAYIARHADRLEELAAEGITGDAALARLPAPEAGERRNIHVFETFGTDFYSFNCREHLSDGRLNPFREAAVRRAFVKSVDRNAIVRQVTRLNEPVATTLIPGGIAGYTSPEGLDHDPEGARAELAAAGWTDTDGDGLVDDGEDPFPVIDLLWTTNTPRYKWISLELKAQWERELGVRIELRGADTKFYKEDLKQGKFMIARGRWYGDYGDPTTFLNLCRTGDGNNDRGYSSSIVDELLEAADSEPDPEARMRMLEQCETHLFGGDEPDVPMLVICRLVQVYMYEPGVLEGLSDHPRLTQYLWQLEADE